MACTDEDTSVTPRSWRWLRTDEAPTPNLGQHAWHLSFETVSIARTYLGISTSSYSAVFALPSRRRCERDARDRSRDIYSGWQA